MFSGLAVGRMPWPRLKMCPVFPFMESRTRVASILTLSDVPSRMEGSRFPWTAMSAGSESRNDGRSTVQSTLRHLAPAPIRVGAWCAMPFAKMMTGKSAGSAAMTRRIHLTDISS